MMLCHPSLLLGQSVATLQRSSIRFLSVRPFKSDKLHIAVILGSTRTDGPPFPAPLGTRVGKWVESLLHFRGHDVTIIDPVSENLPLLTRPHFAYPKTQAPKNLDRLADTFRTADGFVAITPEYNHAPSPALLNIFNHFGSSLFSYKPSAIVTYSAGQWGGCYSEPASITVVH